MEGPIGMDIELLQESVVARYSTAQDIEIYRKRADEELRIWEQRVVERYMRPGRVLCIGCGGGRECFALEQLGYCVTGVDIVDAQVKSAMATAADRNSSVEFFVYDGKILPFADGIFDAVTLWSQVLGNVPGTDGRRSLLREVKRVLVPGGVASLSVHDGAKTMRRLVESGDAHSVVEDGEPGDIKVDTPGGIQCYWHYFTREEITQTCSSSGFASVDAFTSDGLGQNYDNLHIVVCR